jgi:hypothetical protein
MKIPRQVLPVIVLCSCVLLASPMAHAKRRRAHARARAEAKPAVQWNDSSATVRLKLTDGTYLTVDEATESGQGIWYQRGGMSHLIARDRVKAIERRVPSQPKPTTQDASLDVDDEATNQDGSSNVPAASQDGPAWIHLVGGARVEVDSVTESAIGAWYRRNSLTVFVERKRIDHIERPEFNSLADASAKRATGWTTGSAKLDGFIRHSGAKYGVDPYLIFCVMEQESHFNARALSPKGARGLMQLMPGTAARLGVKRPSDPAQNIAGGTRYLKMLLNQFNGRVDLALAGYNAGEGAVMKFGGRVPPYRETRDYVKRISYRYRRAKPVAKPKSDVVVVGMGQ